MTSLPSEPVSDSGTSAPRRKRVWWKRWKLWLPLGLVVVLLNACTPDYDYVWFEADVTVDGESLTVTQLMECAYDAFTILPVQIQNPCNSEAAVGARLKGGAGLMVWHYSGCSAVVDGPRRGAFKYIAGVNWLDDIRKPVRMEFYPTHTSLTAEGSRVRLNDVRFKKGPNFILQALLYPAYWRDNIFGVTWTIPYLDKTSAEIRARRFVGLIACITPEDKWRQYETVAQALETFSEPTGPHVFDNIAAVIGGERRSAIPGKFTDMVAFTPGNEFFDDCARGLPHVPGEGWVFDGDPASLPLFMPAHEAQRHETTPVASRQPEYIEMRGEGFLIKRYGYYSLYLPGRKIFVHVTPVGTLSSTRAPAMRP